MIFLALLKWNELPVSVRRSRKRLYNYIKSEIEGDTAEETEDIVLRDLSFTIETGDPSEPVEGAVVSVAEKTATTDNSGVATITDVLDDTYEVVVECEGYETSTSSITVDETHTSFTISLEEASEQQEET